MSRKFKQHKYNYFYKITNNLNGHFYYGVHCTDNLNDGYMGSGTRLHYAYKKYSMENFSKEILKFFNTPEEAFKYESEYVNEELVKNPDCYNIQQGGAGWNTVGMATVRDKDGNIFDVPVDDPRYLSGELVGHTKGRGIYRDNSGNYMMLSADDERVLNKEVVGFFAGKVTVKDNFGNTFCINKNDPKYLSGELNVISKGMVIVKDKTGKYYQVSIKDPRYLSGELKPMWCGKKHSEKTKEKFRKKFKEIGHQQGEKNSQYGTCWIHRIIDNQLENKKIKKEEIENYLSNGWIKGRKMHL